MESERRCHLALWPLRLHKCPRANRVHLAYQWATACLTTLLSLLSSYVTIYLTSVIQHCSSVGLEAKLVDLVPAWPGPAWGTRLHPASDRGASSTLLLFYIPKQKGFSTLGCTDIDCEWFPYCSDYYCLQKCQGQAETKWQSREHSMIFKVKVSVIYKIFPTWSFAWEKKKVMIFFLPSSQKVKAMPRMSPKNITLIFNFKNLAYCHQVQSPSEIH